MKRLWLTNDFWQIHWRAGILVVFGVALILRLLLMNAWYTADLSRFENGDYPLYRIGADHIAAEGNLSNSLFLVRTPLLPLIMHGFNLTDKAVLIFDIFMGALIAPLTVICARKLELVSGAALLAGLIVAFDPGSIVYSTFLGPEPLANLLLLVSIIALLIGVGLEPGRRAWGWGLLAGIALSLSMLARPAAYLLWIGVGLWLLVTHRRHWAMLAIFALTSVLTVAGWSLHNREVFNNTTFSTVGPYAMVYYHAAAVEHWATGDDMDTVYTSINRRIEEHMGHDSSGVDAATRDGYLAATPEVAAALNAVSLEIFREHPLLTIVSIPVGFSRMYGITTAVLSANPLIKLLEMGWNTVFVLLTGVGLLAAARDRQWKLFWGMGVLGAYFTVGTLLVKSSGMSTRERSMLTPFMASATVYALLAIRQWWTARQAQPTTPPNAAHQGGMLQ